jgi:hypothetical protein
LNAQSMPNRMPWPMPWTLCLELWHLI